MSCYISDKEIEEFVPTKYFEQFVSRKSPWNSLSDTTKARELAKKTIYSLKLVRSWVFEILDYVSLPRAIDMFWEEAEKEGFLERNKWRK